MRRRISLYDAVCLLNRYGYLTNEEALKAGGYALKHYDHSLYDTGRVIISVYRHYDDTYTISLTYGPDEEDRIIITEKEIPELGI